MCEAGQAVTHTQTISPGRWDATTNMAKMICNRCRTVYETDATAHCSCGGELDYVAAQAYAAALVAAHCLQLDPEDPLAAARRLRTTTFFGVFELDPVGLQRGHRLAVVSWRGGRRRLLLADAA